MDCYLVRALLTLKRGVRPPSEVRFMRLRSTAARLGATSFTLALPAHATVVSAPLDIISSAGIGSATLGGTGRSNTPLHLQLRHRLPRQGSISPAPAGARGRTRTGTQVSPKRILSPFRKLTTHCFFLDISETLFVLC